MPLRHKGLRSAIDSVPQEGKIVLIKEQDTLRGTWMMERIEETIVVGDSNVHSAKVRLPSHKIISGLINLLYLLELPVKHDHTTKCRPGVSWLLRHKSRTVNVPEVKNCCSKFSLHVHTTQGRIQSGGSGS